jgi:hypothetical protein
MKPLLDVSTHRRAEHDAEDAAERMATRSRTDRCWLRTHGVWAASRDEIAGAYSGTNTPLSMRSNRDYFTNRRSDECRSVNGPRVVPRYRSSMTATHQTDATATAVRAEHGRPPRRLSTETKSAFKTTEFVIYVVAVLGVLLASLLVKHTTGHLDYFRADKAWFYIVLLTIGYLGSRGLAKSGTRDHHNAPRD